jgi:ATP-dependent helicase/nuclease subunit B
MIARGDVWLDRAAAMDAPNDAVPLEPRPSPRPPLTARPNELPVTAIAKLIRDPYAIYARYVLRLKPMDPLRPGPDPRLRGQVLHRILETYLRNPPEDQNARARLMAIAEALLAEDVAWPSARAFWLARLERAADLFLSENTRLGGVPVLLEEAAGIDLPGIGFRLTARPDRIDVLPDGRLHLIDYKTGAVPTEKQQALFDNQLLLEACMAVRGAFGPDLATDVASIAYIGLGSSLKVEMTEMTPGKLGQTWDRLMALIVRYQQRGNGYTARRALFEDRIETTYDHLSRYGEWDGSQPPQAVDVGGAP